MSWAKMRSRTIVEAKDKTRLKEEFSMETLNNMLAEMLIHPLKNLPIQLFI
jgi:2-phospho-L-lactate guanylyltransferase (CobY/MobA/RfbA family)